MNCIDVEDNDGNHEQGNDRLESGHCFSTEIIIQVMIKI